MLSRAFAVSLALQLQAILFVELGAAAEIVATKTNACLYTAGQPTNKTLVQVGYCKDNALDWNWFWNVSAALSDGGPILMGDRFCLDVSGSDFANGTQLQLYQCLGNAAQTWKIGDGVYVSLSRLWVFPLLMTQHLRG